MTSAPQINSIPRNKPSPHLSSQKTKAPLSGTNTCLKSSLFHLSKQYLPLPNYNDTLLLPVLTLTFQTHPQFCWQHWDYELPEEFMLLYIPGHGVGASQIFMEWLKEEMNRAKEERGGGWAKQVNAWMGGRWASVPGLSLQNLCSCHISCCLPFVVLVNVLRIFVFSLFMPTLVLALFSMW